LPWIFAKIPLVWAVLLERAMRYISANELALVTGGAARSTSRRTSTLSTDQLGLFQNFMTPLKSALANQNNPNNNLLPLVMVAALANQKKNSVVAGPGFVATA
jgi:hypothetical protein